MEEPCPACNKRFCAECSSELGGYCEGCEKLFCSCYAGRMQVVSYQRHLMDDCEECEKCRLQPSEGDRIDIKYGISAPALPFFANRKALVDELLSSTNLATFFTLPTPATTQAVKQAFLSARQHARESHHPQRQAALLLLQRLKRKAMDLAPYPNRAASFRTFNDGLSDEEYEEGMYSDAENDDIDTDDGYDWAGAWAVAATMLVCEDVAEADATFDEDPARVRAFLVRAAPAAAAAGQSAVGAEPIGPATAASGPSVGQKRGHVEV